MHKSQSLFNLTTALHVSGVTITHLQEYKTTVTTANEIYQYNNITRKLYKTDTAIWYNKIIMVTRYCSYSCFVLLKMGYIDARNM